MNGKRAEQDWWSERFGRSFDDLLQDAFVELTEAVGEFLDDWVMTERLVNAHADARRLLDAAREEPDGGWPAGGEAERRAVERYERAKRITEMLDAGA